MDRIPSARALAIALIAVACVFPIAGHAADTAPSAAASKGACPAGYRAPVTRADPTTTRDGGMQEAELSPEPSPRPHARRLSGTWRALPSSPFASSNPTAIWADG